MKNSQELIQKLFNSLQKSTKTIKKTTKMKENIRKIITLPMHLPMNILGLDRLSWICGELSKAVNIGESFGKPSFCSN